MITTCIDSGNNPATVDVNTINRKMKKAMIRDILIGKMGFKNPILEKEDVMDILSDNYAHPHYVSSVDFVRWRDAYVELGVLCRISGVR